MENNQTKIKHGSEIGKNNNCLHTETTCEGCGKKYWVQCLKDGTLLKHSKLCAKCNTKRNPIFLKGSTPII